MEILRAAWIAAVFVCITLAGEDAVRAQTAGDERQDEQAASREMDFDEEGAQEEMAGYTEGTVIAVNPGARTFVVQEEDGDVFTIFMKDAATIEGVGSLKEMSAGDKVNVDYYDMKGRHVAENVAVEDLTPSPGAGQDEKLQKVLSD